LSDRLKHLNRLENLGMLLSRKRVFQHGVLQKLDACPIRATAGIFPRGDRDFPGGAKPLKS
jgi:hypothetical protein